MLQTHEVYDVTGAGDTVAAVMGLAVSAGISLADAARLANTAAGLVVGAVGTAVVEREVLARLVDGGSSGARSRILSAKALRARLEDARARGAKVVLTSGCFDLLHVGHLHLLQRARALGDLLVVAINDDASARALKGPGRPLVPEAQRAETLAALRFVDYVTVFSGRTPIRLMRAIRPDTLVAGAGDPADRIAGRAFVESYGGRVEVVGRVPVRSTSELLATIRKRRII